jgi:hypothetical protein
VLAPVLGPLQLGRLRPCRAMRRRANWHGIPVAVVPRLVFIRARRGTDAGLSLTLRWPALGALGLCGPSAPRSHSEGASLTAQDRCGARIRAGSWRRGPPVWRHGVDEAGRARRRSRDPVRVVPNPVAVVRLCRSA